MRILAIDPGNVHTAWLMSDGNGCPIKFRKEPNEDVLKSIDLHRAFGANVLAIETLHPRGMPTAFEEMQAQLWAGRFIQAWGGPYVQIKRSDVKMSICGLTRAKDSNIRQALIDRWGGKAMAIGKKKTPGPLYGISADCWSALAIAVTVATRQDLYPEIYPKPELIHR